MTPPPHHPARAPIETWLHIGLAAVGTALAVGALEVTAVLREQSHGRGADRTPGR